MQDSRQTVFVYLRVSTDRQDLDNQRHGVMEYAKQHGFESLTFFEDKASGKKDWQERDIKKLLNSAKNGDILIVAEVSRLARSTKQVLDVLESLAKKGVTVHIAKERLVMDGSMMSTVMATVLGLFSQIEAAFISARTTEALARRKAAGLPVGRQKGTTLEHKKLDKYADKIREYLELGVPKQKIMEKVGCCEHTLYKWMHANGFSAYIRSKDKNEKAIPTPAPAAVPNLLPARAKRGGKAKAAARV